ncbi:MAG: hypothetical protein OEW89_02300 [Gammaproteobacteria bacterium]|nr:hypothetical protein [Gammaproteobacteria bacterium]
MSYLSIFINDKLAFEYDLSKTLDDSQLAFLDKMDSVTTAVVAVIEHV